MRFTIETEDLVSGIGAASRAVSGKNGGKLLDCVLIKAEGGSVVIVGNSLEFGIETAPLEAVVNEPGSAAVDARLIGEISKKLPGDTVVFTSGENNRCGIVCGKARFSIQGFPGGDYPALDKIEAVREVRLKPADLRSMVRGTVFSAAADGTRPIMTGERFKLKDGVFSVAAVDGYRISLRRMALPGANNFEVIIPARPLSETVRLLPDGDGTVTIAAGERRARIISSACSANIALLEGSFYDCEKNMTIVPSTVLTVSRRALYAAVERASVMAYGQLRAAVRLTLDGGGVLIKSDTEKGSSEDVVEGEVTGDALEIGFNPGYMLDALRAVEDEEVTLHFSGALKPCVIKPAKSENCEDGRYAYLILPLRLRA